MSETGNAPPATKVDLAEGLSALRAELIAVLDTKATKADLEELRASISEDVRRQIAANWEEFDRRYASLHDVVAANRDASAAGQAELRTIIDVHTRDLAIHVRRRPKRPAGTKRRKRA